MKTCYDIGFVNGATIYHHRYHRKLLHIAFFIGSLGKHQNFFF